MAGQTATRRSTETRRPSAGRAAETLSQLGWEDQHYRLLTLRLTDPQWQTVQQAVLRATPDAPDRCTPGQGTPGECTTEQLLTGCLRQWLHDHGADDEPPEVFEPRESASDGRPFAGLERWLAAFNDDALFRVTVKRESDAAAREQNFRQVSAEGVARLVARHGRGVRRIEHEPLPASAWNDAIDRFGTCE